MPGVKLDSGRTIVKLDTDFPAQIRLLQPSRVISSKGCHSSSVASDHNIQMDLSSDISLLPCVTEVNVSESYDWGKEFWWYWGLNLGLQAC
jgi:hypothetical protein